MILLTFVLCFNKKLKKPKISVFRRYAVLLLVRFFISYCLILADYHFLQLCWNISFKMALWFFFLLVHVCGIIFMSQILQTPYCFQLNIFLDPYTWWQQNLFYKTISAAFQILQIHIHRCYCTKNLGTYSTLNFKFIWIFSFTLDLQDSWHTRIPVKLSQNTDHMHHP